MTSTASQLLEQMLAERIAAGEERNIRLRLRGGVPRYQVRMRDGERMLEPTFATAAEAVEERDRLVDAREAGDVLASAPASAFDPTLAEACEAFLAGQEIRFERGRLAKRGLGHYRESSYVWRVHEQAPPERGRKPKPAPAFDPTDRRRRPFASYRLSELTAPPVGRYLRHVREPEAPTAARNDRQTLLQVLREAALDGARVDPGLLALPPIDEPRREVKRRVLELDELELLDSCAPEYARGMIELAGSAGFRIGELFTLDDDRVYLDEPAVFIPAHLCKERRDKTIPLLPAEARIVRRALLARSTSAAPRVFAKRQGGPWRYSYFHRLVWTPARKRAAIAWRTERGLAAGAPTPFDGLRVQDLRRTAATLMRQAGLELEFAAQRLGHGDGGRLLLDVYRQTSSTEAAAGVAALGDSLEAAIAAERKRRQAASS